MKLIAVNHLTAELERKKIKNLYLKVLPPDGRIHITAPIRMSEQEIRSFINSKQDWIEKQQTKLRNRNTHQELEFISGEEIYLWGMKYRLDNIATKGRPEITFEGDRLIMKVREESTPDKRKQLLDRYYKEALLDAVPVLLSKWEGIIGVSSEGFRIRDMKTRWGTCNIRTKNICFSLQLAKKPPRCLEYVVVHELVHLLEQSHNRIFKGYLDLFLPDWRMIRKALNGIH